MTGEGAIPTYIKMNDKNFNILFIPQIRNL